MVIHNLNTGETSKRLVQRAAPYVFGAAFLKDINYLSWEAAYR